MSRSQFLLKISLHIILPLLVGFSIYLSGRHNTLLNDYLPASVDLPSFVQGTWWGSVLVFNLPDFCWDYSLASALFLWRSYTRVRVTFFPAKVLALLLSVEFIQLLMPGSFTFDWLDLVAALPAFSLSWYLNPANEKG